MKRILLSLITISSIGVLLAQNAGDIALAKSAMTIERKAVFSQNMGLSDEESKLFWPIYEAYETEKSNTFETSIKNLMDVADNFETMTDDKATEIIAVAMKNQMKDKKLLDQYQKKIAKVLGPKKAFRFVQIEMQIDAIRSMQLLEIPLIE